LPFLFGAKAQTIKERYWIRVVSPPPKPKHFRLEAVPKRREEAADFVRIEVEIDEKEFLPTALILLERGGGHTTYQFTERETNWSLLPEMVNPFTQQFYAPKTPAGWKRVDEPFRAEPAPAAGPVTKAPMIGPAQSRQAQGVPIGRSAPSQRR
jgi:hypothetical protein